MKVGEVVNIQTKEGFVVGTYAGDGRVIYATGDGYAELNLLADSGSAGPLVADGLNSPWVEDYYDLSTPKLEVRAEDAEFDERDVPRAAGRRLS